MLTVSQVSKSFGVQTVLQDVSFVMNRGARTGLVGPNGAGKSTLLRIMAGLDAPDSGSVRLDPHATLGYLPQGLELASDLTLGAAVRAGVAAWDAAEHEMARHATALALAPHDPARLEAYTAAVSRFEELGGYEVVSRLDAVLRGLGVDDLPGEMPIAKLSGGQRTRAGLARLLIASPDLLLLDEPTNHLDVAALEWLEQFVRDYPGAVLIVSHDRVFLDRTVSQILELDEATHRVATYRGNYSAYEAARAHQLEQQWAAWQDQQVELARLTDAARHLRGVAKFRRGGKADTNDKFARGFFANRSRATVARAKHLERRIEQLQTEDRVDKPRAGYALKLDFGDAASRPRSGQVVMTLESVGIRFGDRVLLNDCSQILTYGQRVALVGSNGSGKTTLLRIMTGELAPTSGAVRLGANVRIGYMPQEQETLDPAQTPLALVRSLLPLDETGARHYLHHFMFERDEVFTPNGQLSYGERARLILARLVAEQANLLLLDEPINHLDIPSRERFEAALESFPGTIVVAAHDRAFIERFARGLWALEHRTLHAYPDLAAWLRAPA